MGQMYVRNRVLLAKEEATYNVDSVPTVGLNAIQAMNVGINYQGDMLTRDNIRNTISPEKPIVGKRWVELTFTCELKGSGSLGVAPRIGDLLEACAFAETVDAGSSVVYKPTSSGKKSVTLYLYDLDSEGSSAKLHKITGAIGNVVLRMTAGAYATLEFTLRGNYNAMADVAVPATPTFETTSPPVVESAAFTWDSGTDLVVQELSIDMENQITDRDDISSPNGLKGFDITNREPKGAMNPEATLLATEDFGSDWAASNSVAMSTVVGSAAGNKCTITAPIVTVESISDAERDRLLTTDIPIRFNANAGDDEVVLTFE